MAKCESRILMLSISDTHWAIMSDPRCLTIEHATDLTIDTRRLNDRNGYQNVDLVKQPTDPMLETTVVSLRNAHRSTASLSR